MVAHERQCHLPAASPCPPGIIRVGPCGCSQVHIAIGPITVRLASDDSLTLCETLLAAARHLPPDRPEPVH